MKSDHDIVRETSLSVRHWLQVQPAVKEDSITDWLLYTLSEKIPRITYRAFNRTEEARITGADWEWWLLYPRYSFKMRVQAKKLFPGKDNYSGIARTNQHGLQIDKLLSDARQGNFAPFYAFYTAETETVMCRKNINDEGVYIAGATNVYQKIIGVAKAKVATSDALVLSVALSCLFGCPAIFNDPEQGPLRFFRQYFPLELARDPVNSTGLSDDDQNVLGFHSKIPNYVSSLLQNKEKTPDWWEGEFSSYLHGANAIVVYDARNG